MVDTNSKLTKKTRAEKILDDIETHLRKLISEKKELKKNFLTKIKEIERKDKENQAEMESLIKQFEREFEENNKSNQEWFENNWKEAERLENKLVLLWDYWRREVEILSLERKLQVGALPSEREKIMEEIKKLNSLNITLEQGFKKRKIDAEVVKELRKRLGIWEEKES